MKYISYIVMVIACTYFTNNMAVFNRSFFYRASSFYGEPKLTWPLLSTAEIQFSGGDTHRAYNNHKKRTYIKNLFNSKEDDIYVRQSYIKGAFEIFQLDINLYQNIYKGFFCHFHLPFSQINLTHINSYKTHGLSDSTLFLGWAINYENTEYIDYIDFNIKTGVLFPTGEKTKRKPLSIPLGYNGHWGVPLSINASLGMYNWLTLGTYLDAVFLTKNKELLHNSEQTFICKKNVCPGNVYRAGAYFKADRCVNGASFIIGVDHEHHTKSDISRRLLLHNPHLREWNRTQIHLLFEYDFASEEQNMPRIGICYNKNLKGKNILATNIFDGYIGFDLNWLY